MYVEILNSRKLAQSEIAKSISTIEGAIADSAINFEWSHGPGFIKRIAGATLPSAKCFQEFKRLGCTVENLKEHSFEAIRSYLYPRLGSLSRVRFRWEVIGGSLKNWTNLAFSFSYGIENGQISAAVHCGYWGGGGWQERVKFFEILIGLGLQDLIKVHTTEDGFELLANQGASIDFPISELQNRNPSAFRVYGLSSFEEANAFCRRLLDSLDYERVEQSIGLRFDTLESLGNNESGLNQLIPNCNGQMIGSASMSPEEFAQENGQDSIELMPVFSAWLTPDGPELVLNIVRSRDGIRLQTAVVGEENLHAFNDVVESSQELQDLDFTLTKTVLSSK